MKPELAQDGHTRLELLFVIIRSSQRAKAKLGTRLRKLRLDRRHSGQIVAEKLGKTPDTIYKWERGVRTPNLEDVCRFLEFYGQSPPAVLQAIVNSLPPEGYKPAPATAEAADDDSFVNLARRNSEVQQAIRQRESIKTFELFLHSASAGEWERAYALVASGWRQEFTEPDDIRLFYRMTSRHAFHYYIPTEITNKREEYDAEFSYWDFFPFLQYRRSCVQMPLSALVNENLAGQLTADLLTHLPSCYEVPAEFRGEIDDRVGEFVDRLTLRDLVMRDDLIEELGRKLGLTPIRASRRTQGKAPATERRRLFHVILVKEDGRWLVEGYDSIMVEKR